MPSGADGSLPPGSRCGVEALTYPGVKAIATQLGETRLAVKARLHRARVLVREYLDQ